jgi:signal recognition particle receptor subunit beta
MELPEGTLVTNLFIPAMVACTKIDLIQQGDQEVKEVLARNMS